MSLRRLSVKASRPKTPATGWAKPKRSCAADVTPGMSVADVGAGEGYYTVRLSPMSAGAAGCWPRTSSPETRDRWLQRVQRENLDNVAVKLGQPADPMLPKRSFDRIFLVHMYHEVNEPYEFLWNLREGLKPDGMVIVVDSDRPVKRHGMPPRQLICEFAALGMAPLKIAAAGGSDAYFAAFRIAAPRPATRSDQAVHGRAGLKQAPSVACWCSCRRRRSDGPGRPGRCASAARASRRVARQSAGAGPGRRRSGDCAPEPPRAAERAASAMISRTGMATESGSPVITFDMKAAGACHRHGQPTGSRGPLRSDRSKPKKTGARRHGH